MPVTSPDGALAQRRYNPRDAEERPS